MPNTKAVDSHSAAKRSGKSKSQTQHKKLARLPPTHKISKRPLLHPAIPSPRTSASTPKVIYISASSPFISILKRTRKLLNHIEDRAAGEIKLTRDGKETFKAIERGLAKGGSGSGKARPRDEEVQLRATGKAVQRALQVGVKLQAESGYRVRFETGTVGAVDDVVEREGVERRRERRRERTREGGDGSGDVEMGEGRVDGEGEVKDDSDILEESRLRRVGCLIVYVGLK